MNRDEQIKSAWDSAFKNVVESIDTERTKEDVACMFFELGCRWADETRTNWQQVRIQAAIAAMQGILANQSSVVVRDEVVIQTSVSLADALVKELKGE